MAQLSDRVPIAERDGLPTRWFLRWVQELFSGTIQRTVYTEAELATMAPKLGLTAFCSDSSVTTFGNVLAGGGANVVPVYGDDTNWRVG